MSRLRGVSVKQLRADQPISESVIQQVAAKENLVDVANFNVQLHGDMVSLMEECTEGFKIVRNTETEVGLDAWRLLNHKYDLRNLLRNIQLLERLLAPSQGGYSDVVARMERLEQELRVVRQRFGDGVQNGTDEETCCLLGVFPIRRRVFLTVWPLVKKRRSLLAYAAFAIAFRLRIGSSRGLGHLRFPSCLLLADFDHVTIRATQETVAFKLL